MKKIDIKKLIDFDQELKDMIDYTLNIWEGDINELTQIITESFTSGYNVAENWIDEYAFTDLSSNWIKSREKLMNESYIMDYDDVINIANNLVFNSTSLKDLVLKDWNYEKVTDDLTDSIKKTLSNGKVFPKGWEKVKDSKKSAYEYFTKFNLKEDNQFKGHNSATAGANGFHERINLANTFYSNTEQRRSALLTLVSSAFAHGLVIRKNNNTFELIEDVKRIKNSFEKEEFNKPIFINDLESLSNNKFFKALMHSKYSDPIEREYNSQIELDNYIKEIKENKNIYGLVEISMFGNDDYQYEGFKIQKIFSLEHFEKQIKQKVDDWVEGKEHKEMYYSDNNSTPVEKSEILSSLKFKKVSEKEFNAIKKVLDENGKSDSVSYGDTEEFMDYDFPNKKEIDKIGDDIMESIMTELENEEKEPGAIAKTEIRENKYKDSVSSILGINLENKRKLKK